VKFGTRSVWIDDVLDAVGKEVRESLGLPNDKVFSFIGRPEDLADEFMGDEFATVTPQNLPLDQTIVAGVAETKQVIDTTVMVTIYSRLWTDKPGRNAFQLNDKARGLAVKARKAAKRLHKNNLATNSEAMLQEPMRLLSMAFHGAKPAAGIGFVTLTMSVKFVTDLS